MDSEGGREGSPRYKLYFLVGVAEDYTPHSGIVTNEALRHGPPLNSDIFAPKGKDPPVKRRPPLPPDSV